MKIYALMTDDANGIRVRLFTNQVDMDAAALAWCKDDWPLETPCPDDWRAAYEEIVYSDDAIWCEEFDVSDSDAVAAITASARAQIDDLLTQIYQMQGLFEDSDGAIQKAIDAAEAWPG